jgi:hypothetical protein
LDIGLCRRQSPQHNSAVRDFPFCWAARSACTVRNAPSIYLTIEGCGSRGPLWTSSRAFESGSKSPTRSNSANSSPTTCLPTNASAGAEHRAKCGTRRITSPSVGWLGALAAVAPAMGSRTRLGLRAVSRSLLPGDRGNFNGAERLRLPQRVSHIGCLDNSFNNEPNPKLASLAAGLRSNAT